MSAVKRVAFIELALKKCQLTHGTAPCTATGEPCFNSRATCQDLPNISEADEIVRFAKPSTNIPTDISCIQNIAQISYEPAKLDLGNSIGIRSSLRVSFKDHRSPDTDASGDPYIIARDYNPYELGTYWGKFRARHPFIRGQSIWLVQGTDNQRLEDMSRRQFIVESASGPDANGNYNIVAKDILKAIQGDRAQAPKLSQGYLQSAITNGQGTLTLSPAGVGSLYPASGFAAIGGKEIVSFTRTGDDMVIGRGTNGTQGVAHEADSRVQLCLVYTAERPSDIFYDLLTGYSQIDPSLIPLSDWTNESETQIGRVYSTLIAQPTPVEDLINELIEQTASTMWWDEESSLLRWSVLKNPSSSAFVYTDDFIISGSFNVADQPQKRVSQVWFYYGQINPLLELGDKRNYESSLLSIDTDSEIAYGSPAYRNIFSRWINADARDTAQVISNLVLQRYSTPPRKLGFKVMQNTLESDAKLGASYFLRNLFIQDQFGNPQDLPIQITSIVPNDSTIEIQAEEVTFSEIEFQDPNVVNLYPSDGTLNYNILTAYIQQTGQNPTSETVVNVYVESGFKIGSSYENSYGTNRNTVPRSAIKTGDYKPFLEDIIRFPAGSTINIYNNGHISGAGGRGGKGAIASIIRTPVQSTSDIGLSSNSDGEIGADAISVSEYFEGTLNVFNEGIISGGGGGQAGGRSGFGYLDGVGDCIAYIAGNGGSGGAGIPAGTGGTPGNRNVVYPGRVPEKPALNGSDGGTLTGGSVLDGSYDIDGPYSPGTEVLSVIVSNISRKGGDLGQSGDISHDVAFSNSGGTLTIAEQSTSKIGGLPGRAVMRRNKNVNISGSGQILGAISDDPS